MTLLDSQRALQKDFRHNLKPDPAAGRMAEEALNLSLDDIIKRNAENNKRKSSSSAGAGKRGGRGGRGGRGSSFQPKGLGVQSRVVKTIRGGRGQSRGGRDRVAPRVRLAQSSRLNGPKHSVL